MPQEESKTTDRPVTESDLDWENLNTVFLEASNFGCSPQLLLTAKKSMDRLRAAYPRAEPTTTSQYDSVLNRATPREIKIEGETQILVNRILANPVFEVREIIKDKIRMQNEIDDLRSAFSGAKGWMKGAPLWLTEKQ